VIIADCWIMEYLHTLSNRVNLYTVWQREYIETETGNT